MNEAENHKIPIWIGTDCKLVSGISRSTTCNNIIQSILRNENTGKYVIVEKWKKMERRLDGNVKILKVWKAWGDQKDDVAFILRQHQCTDGYIDKKLSSKAPRRSKTSSGHHRTSGYGDGGGDEAQVPEPMERLLKLVLTQGETIQSQLRKLRHQEEQIERYEEQMHRMRSLQEGDNYVVESYLRDDKGKKSSSRKRDKSPRKQKQQQQGHSQETNSPPKSDSKRCAEDDALAAGPDDLLDCPLSAITVGREGKSRSGNDERKLNGDASLEEESELMERICDLNSKLTKEEEHLVKLGLKLKKFHERHPHFSQDQQKQGSSGAKNRDSNSSPAEDNEKKEIKQLEDQLEALRDLTEEQSQEIELNEKSLNELETMLDGKQDQLATLTYQIQLVDQESEFLRQRLFNLSQTQGQVQQDQQSTDTRPQQQQQHQLKQSQSEPQKPPTPSSHQQQSAIPLANSFPSINSPTNNNDMTLQPFPALGQELSASLTPTAYHVKAKLSLAFPQQTLQVPAEHYVNNNIPLDCHQQQNVVAAAARHRDPINLLPYSVDHAFNPNIATIMNFSNPQPETIPITAAQLNLHMKPACRDSQDNDSNSDTGISSLHSSGDENNMFVLDTLV